MSKDLNHQIKRLPFRRILSGRTHESPFLEVITGIPLLFPVIMLYVSSCQAGPLTATDLRPTAAPAVNAQDYPAAAAVDCRPEAITGPATVRPAAPDNGISNGVDSGESLSGEIVGEIIVHKVKKGESLRNISAKYGVSRRRIARENHLKPSSKPEPGSEIIIDSRRIVPKSMQSGIVINIPERALYLFKDNQPEKVFPVGLGRKKGQTPAMWHTPTGNFRITGKQKNPAWHVPISIRNEMKLKKRDVVSVVPPGNRNPLGNYALRTSMPGIMIHGTTAPDSVYGFSSHGCIRMRNENIRELFKEINVRSRGEIIYQPVKMAVTDRGRVLLEVHEDIYGKYKNLDAEVKRLIGINNAESIVDWQKIKDCLVLKSGMISDVTLENVSRHTAKAIPQQPSFNQ